MRSPSASSPSTSPRVSRHRESPRDVTPRRFTHHRRGYLIQLPGSRRQVRCRRNSADQCRHAGRARPGSTRPRRQLTSTASPDRRPTGASRESTDHDVTATHRAGSRSRGGGAVGISSRAGSAGHRCNGLAEPSRDDRCPRGVAIEQIEQCLRGDSHDDWGRYRRWDT